MAALTTLSAFTYGHTIDTSNNVIEFIDSDGLTFIGEIASRSYSLQEFPDAVATAMNSTATSQLFEATLDRATRTITISSDQNFTILFETGARVAFSGASLIGFEAIDLTGSNTYTAPNPSGFIYRPQKLLDKFVAFEDEVRKATASVKTTASGDVEVVSYGDVNFMECNIDYVTNITGQGVLENNPRGVDDLRDFMTYIINKRPIEFLPDRDGMEFTRCILESTPLDRKGTAFRLNEMYSVGLAFYFQTGKLSFRQLN